MVTPWTAWCDMKQKRNGGVVGAVTGSHLFKWLLSLKDISRWYPRSKGHSASPKQPTCVRRDIECGILQGTRLQFKSSLAWWCYQVTRFQSLKLLWIKDRIRKQRCIVTKIGLKTLIVITFREYEQILTLRFGSYYSFSCDEFFQFIMFASLLSSSQ